MFSPLLALTLTLASHHGERVYHDSLPLQMADSVISMDFDAMDMMSVRAEARVALDKVKERPGRSEESWSLRLESPDDTLAVTISHGNSDYGDILDERYTHIEAVRNDSVLFAGRSDGFSTHKGAYNTLTAECGKDGNFVLSGGGKERVDIFNTVLDSPFVPKSTSLEMKGSGKVTVFCCETTGGHTFSPEVEWSFENLAEHIRTSTDPMEGFWRYLDRENDPEYARPGGRYILATVRKRGGGYDIIYVDGAVTCADRWKPMMLKGRLNPTIFSYHYDLQWIDSSFDEITEDIHAQVTDNAILSLSFPLLKTVMRFSKIPLSQIQP